MIAALWALAACSGRAEVEFTCPQLAWVHQVGGPFAETIAGVEVAANGDILVGGGFGATVNFGTDVFGFPVTRSACGNNYLADAFVASYHPNGLVNWVATLSSCQFSRTYALAATPSGGAVAVGLFD